MKAASTMHNDSGMNGIPSTGSVFPRPPDPEAAARRQRGLRIQVQSILMAMGLFVIVFELVVPLVLMPKRIPKALEKRTQSVEAKGVEVDPERKQQEAENLRSIARFTGQVYIIAGVALIALGILAARYPVAAASLGLTLFVSAWLALGIWQPITFNLVLLMKVLVAVCLVKALQAALASQRPPRPAPLVDDPVEQLS
jgi:hypothetical protein